ncbi:MAG: InlB B-repeat-containing protein [Chitinispirillales bacterium]|jgi:hypothetical protein|nr:InlB B-repeat-containing protein [Chitinispirillales bacterium]
MGGKRIFNKKTALGGIIAAALTGVLLFAVCGGDSNPGGNGGGPVVGNHTLTVDIQPTAGSGSVALNPPGGSYAAGTQVTLTATPTAPNTFAGWAGGATGTTSPVTVTVNSDMTVTAMFQAPGATQHALSVVANPPNGGTVSGSGLYNAGASANIAAHANNGWSFTGWSTGSQSPTTTVTVNGPMTITANFTQNQQDPCLTAPGTTACCNFNPNHSSCQQQGGQNCYWPPSADNNFEGSCVGIGGEWCDPGITCTPQQCEANHGNVIADCNNPPQIQYCDWGPPVIVGGEVVGGCHPIPAHANPQVYCVGDHGTVVNTCPNYPPPTEGGFCDYGFGNCIPSSQQQCNQFGAFGSSCPNPSGFYCDFGQPTIHGNGGCFFRPSMAAITNPLNTTNDCDEWSTRVSMTACIASNTSNSCIGDPVNPGDTNLCP